MYVNREDVMPIEDSCNREAVILQRDDTVLEAAKLMRRHQVRDVQVIENRDGKMITVGVITDHDLVVEIMAPELDYMVITVGDILDLHAV
jgi:CBS domain-containing protein